MGTAGVEAGRLRFKISGASPRMQAQFHIALVVAARQTALAQSNKESSDHYAADDQCEGHGCLLSRGTAESSPPSVQGEEISTVISKARSVV